MSKLVSIGTAVPAYRHEQEDILDFMQRVYALNEGDKRKLKFLYSKGGIDTRYSVIPDYSLPAMQWQFYSPSENLEPFPKLELRMRWYQQHAAPLSMDAIHKCLADFRDKKITHLITVSCTGMSAPGLDLELLELLQLPSTTFRTSVNFMGCYAAIHALKIADAFCKTDKEANVLVVCTELCTLHFQKENTVDNITSSMLFSDGAAAVLVSGDNDQPGLSIDSFYSVVALKGKQDMAWELSSKGFLMTLSSYVADMIGENFDELVENALTRSQLDKKDITHWCIHPGGKKILEAVHSSLGFTNGQLQPCYDILKEYGNMSSPTVLFVLERIMNGLNKQEPATVFGAAFGPGLTMETLILSS
ncbi:MAG TPA: type III polyketide synthase [Chitinophagaceae bacterium]|nr:type III polyketide synthase [Chitinophagaceae bacterium]